MADTATARCPIEPGTRVRIVSGNFAFYSVATVLRVERARGIAGHGQAAPEWRLTCRDDRGDIIPLLIDEVVPMTAGETADV